MKQFKHKKFIGLALIVFLVFMVLGKYTQSTAFTSSSRVYATTVVDKNTGNKVRLKFVKSRETNTKSKIRRQVILIRLMPKPAKTVL
ncbi:MAG: hypothetical protein ACLS5G_07775 [Streptococcus sp.]